MSLISPIVSLLFLLNIKVNSQQRVSLEFNPLNTLKIEV